MSNKELEKYKLDYEKFVESIVRLHNKNLHFISLPSSERAIRDIRSCVRKIQKQAKELKDNAKLVHAEGLNNSREAREKKRQEVLEKKEQLRLKREAKTLLQLEKEKNNVNNSENSGTI